MIYRLRLLQLVLISAVGGASGLLGQDPAASDFNKDLAEGYEVATVLDSLTSADGKMAVLYTARKNTLKAASGWPVLYPGIVIGQTDAPDESLYDTENWVVSLPEKRRLGQVRSDQPGFIAIYPDFQLHEGLIDNGISALWGPEQEGWHFGLINYDNRWGCCDLFLVNSDGTEASILSIRAEMEKAVREHIAQKDLGGSKPTDFVVGYDLLGCNEEASGTMVGDPLDVRIGFVAEVPKNEDAPWFEGTLAVRLVRNAQGKATARVTALEDGAPAAGSPTAEEFAAFRQEWNDRAEKGAWKVVRQDLPSPGKGRKAYLQGWVEAYVLQRLVHVETRDNDNEIITLYFWREGQLTSVFEFRKGEYTQISEVAEATETYNFVDEKLVGWRRTGDTDTVADPGEEGFADQGREVLRISVERAAPIYQAIGAD